MGQTSCQSDALSKTLFIQQCVKVTEEEDKEEEEKEGREEEVEACRQASQEMERI